MAWALRNQDHYFGLYVKGPEAVYGLSGQVFVIVGSFWQRDDAHRIYRYLYGTNGTHLSQEAS